jgi:hypothetical protein
MVYELTRDRHQDPGEGENAWRHPKSDFCFQLDTPRPCPKLLTITDLHNRYSSLIHYRLVDDHSHHRFSVHFLLRRIHPARFLIDRRAVHSLLYRKVFQLPVVIRIVHLNPLAIGKNAIS